MDEMNREVLVFSEKPDLLAELIGGACSSDGLSAARVTAVVVGPRVEAEQALTAGADRVLWIGDLPDGSMLEDCVPTLEECIKKQQPGVILIGSTRRGRAVAGRLAARLNVSAITDVTGFEIQEDALIARHLIFGGGAVRTEKSLADRVLATVGPGVFSPLPGLKSQADAIVEIAFIQPSWKFNLRQSKPRPPASVNLAKAKKVVCAGRGLVQKEDLDMLGELAHLLQAEIGCTRPLAEGLDWLPRERYIGISGATVKPDLYLGVGVSGQVQHTIGMSEARLVVAINKDSQAPIFEGADYGIVGDLYTVVPALIKALKDRK